VDDIKIIHEESVKEKQTIKINRIRNICNKMGNKFNEISKNRVRSKIQNTFEIMNIK
jgi:hypothetical protein